MESKVLSREGAPKGILYIVSTPIGNLEDITLRALRILKEAALIAAEDTRTAKNLLEHFAIRTPVVSLYSQNEARRAALVLEKLDQGRDVALISESGTPGISDPGETVIAAAIREGFRVAPIPGPTALAAGVTASGLPAAHFYFGGFLPRQAGAVEARLREVRALAASLIFYESPRRLVATLRALRQGLGDREAVVGRELTKVFEEFQRGRLSAVEAVFRGRSKVLGEVVIIVRGAEGRGDGDPDADRAWLPGLLKALQRRGLSTRDAAAVVRETWGRAAGLNRREVYRQGLKSRQANGA